MKQIFPLICITSLMFISCVSSLYPVTENSKDIIFKRELVGTWKDLNGNDKYIVDTTGTGYEKKYKVMILDYDNADNVKDTTDFLVMLVNIKGHYFFDCMPDTSTFAFSNLSDLTKAVTIPCHFIIKVYSIDANYISLSAIDKDALSILLKNKKIIMKHEEVTKDDILITEKPGTLQQKLLEMEHFPSIYKKDSLVKMK